MMLNTKFANLLPILVLVTFYNKVPLTLVKALANNEVYLLFFVNINY